MITWCMMMVVMLAVPAGVLYIYKVSFVRRLARAVGRMLVFLGLTAGGVQLVLSYSHWLVAAGWLLLMVGVSVLMVLHTSRLSWKDFMVPVAAGVCTAVVLAGLLTALAMSNMLEVWNAGFLIPVAGMLTAGLVTCCGKGLSTYYMGLRHHGKLYDYLLNPTYSIADPYMCLYDFEDYCKVSDEITRDYKDRKKWAHKSVTNIAMASHFAADRAVKEYADDIWESVPVVEK